MWQQKKNLDDRHDTTTATQVRAPREPDVVYPMGDYRVSERSSRKFEALLGVQPRVERREVEAFEDERELTDLEKWEKERAKALEKSELDAEIAMKRDESAWVDEDGYSQIKEAPAFRDGLNTTLRVKPPQEDHLHGGLKLVKERADNVSMPQGSAPRQLVNRNTNRRADVAEAVGLLFMRGITTGLEGAKSRDLVKDGERVEGEVSMLLRAIKTVEIPEGYVAETVDAEGGKRQEVLSSALGKAFMDIGMTAPAGKRDDPLRNDVVALNIGNRMMLSAEGGRTIPLLSEPTMRREVALAVGRAMLHLRAAAGIEASRSTAPVSDSGHKDRTKLAIGRLTLQLLEAGASRTGKVLTKDSTRRETLAKAIGSILQMDANEDRETMQERNKPEHAQLNRKAMPGGTLISGSKLPEVARMNRPNENINKRPTLPFGETVLQPRNKI